mmetsp:Transcript_7125/g.19940  ORF Transcript_7125/g.19940 Transcript_7125/m.19940 type:complete len:297 (+) Transcript_7125:85-975(+)
MVGNNLGQYFCHPRLADQVVETCLDRLEQHLILREEASKANSHSSLRTDDESTDILFVEPSCGHGQIVEILLSTLLRENVPPFELQHNHPMSCANGNSSSNITDMTSHRWHHIMMQFAQRNIRILCLDKDPLAVAHCRAKFQDETTVHIEFSCRDFLKSTFHQDNNNHMVAFLGGPPYSAGAGHGNDDMQRTLPMQFVHHSLQEYRAVVVAFLMPRRCTKIMAMMTSAENANNNIGDYGWWNMRRWDHESIPLNGPSKFYFQGRGDAAVTQPSILQCFWRQQQGDTFQRSTTAQVA